MFWWVFFPLDYPGSQNVADLTDPGPEDELTLKYPSGPDPGVQGGLQHDRPQQGRVHRQGGSSRHARFSRQGKI